MKRKFLLTCAAIAALFVGAGNASAQWTAITMDNADLSSGTDKWDISGTWAAGNGTADGITYVLECYSGWDSQTVTDFSLTQKVTLPAGLYKLTGYSLYGATAGNVKLVAKVGDKIISSTNPSGNTGLNSNSNGGAGSTDLKKFANSCNSSYPDYLTTIVFELSGETEVTLGYVGAHTDKRQWFACGPFELYEFEGNASYANPVDFTTMIYNPGYEDGNTNGWTTTSSSDTGAKSASNSSYAMTNSVGNYLFNTWWKGTPCEQTVSYLPAGKYKLSTVAASDGATIYLINGSNSDDYSYIETTDKTTGLTLAKDFFLTSAATDYKVGIVGGANGTAGEHKAYTADGYWWYKCDDFHLTYYGNGVEHYATAFSSGAATADTWYSYPINVAGEYVITSSDYCFFYYTQDGGTTSDNLSTHLVIAAEGFGHLEDLKVGTLYFRTSDASTITIAPTSYSYELGDATLSVANGAYTQNATYTVTYPSAATNDPDVTAALVANSKATVNDTEVALVATENGFTVDLGTLAAATAYTIAIPADVYGYSGHDMNEAINVTVNTPAVFDGTYYLKAGDKGYLAQGGDSNTEALLDPFGCAMTITTDANNVSKLQYVYSGLYFKTSGSTEQTWMNGGDDGKNTWNIAKSGDGITIMSTADNAGHVKSGYSYIEDSYVDNSVTYYNVVNLSTDASKAQVWTVEAIANHPEAMTAYKNTQAAAVATSADISATTVAALKSALSTSYDGFAQTISNSVSDGAESYQYGSGETLVAEQKLENLKAGVYKVSISAIHRPAGYTESKSWYDKGVINASAYIYANDNKAYIASPLTEPSETSYESAGGWAPNVVLDGNNYPNNINAMKQAIQDGKYTLEVFVYVEEGGSLSFGLKDPASYSKSNWTYFKDLNVTYYDKKYSRTTAKDAYGTICLPYAFSATGAKVYSASINESTKEVELAEVTTPVAGTPYIYQATGATQTFAYTSGAVVSAPVDATPLVGTFADKTIGASNNAYVLQTLNGKQNFYKVADDITVPAYKAYITYSGSGAKLSIGFADDDATAVNAVNALVNGTAKIYDINGRQLPALRKGVNIVNGVKVVVK